MGKLYACLNVYQEQELLPDCLRSIRENLPEAEIILIDGAYESWLIQVKLQAAMEMDQGHPEIGAAMLRLTSPASTDDTIKIAKDFKVEHIVNPHTQCMCGGKRRPSGYYEKGAVLPWESEWQKRNEFFRFGRDGDYYFIIDADERLRGRAHLADMIEDHYVVMLKRDDTTAPYPVHRIYKHRPGIKMEGAHMAVWANEAVYDKGSYVIQPVLMKKYGEKNTPLEGRLIAPIFGGWTERADGKFYPPATGGCHLDHMFNLRGKMDQIRILAKGAYYTRGLSKEEDTFRKEHDI